MGIAQATHVQGCKKLWFKHSLKKKHGLNHFNPAHIDLNRPGSGRNTNVLEGHPSKNYPRWTLLDTTDRTITGEFNRTVCAYLRINECNSVPVTSQNSYWCCIRLVQCASVPYLRDWEGISRNCQNVDIFFKYKNCKFHKTLKPHIKHFLDTLNMFHMAMMITWYMKCGNWMASPTFGEGIGEIEVLLSVKLKYFLSNC